MENNSAIQLLRTAIDELRQQKIILPNLTTLERIVWESRDRAEKAIYQIFNDSLSQEQKQKIGQLLASSMGNGKKPLGWLKEYPGSFPRNLF